MERSPEMEIWVQEARAVPIVSVMAMLPLSGLKKSGSSSFAGPCPICAGKDRFWINTSKGIFSCRGCRDKVGNGIDLVKHVLGLSFIGACELITGRPAPDGRKGKRIPEAELQRRRDEIAANNERRKREQERDDKRRHESAREIWAATVPLSGAPLEYLKRRGIDPLMADDQIRAHVGLRHPEGGTFPALVARVSNADGDGTAIWREFVKSDGSGKAPVSAPKLGLGNAAGGSVRIGGIWPHICVAEGILTSLAVREIIGGGIPVWAALSTSGMSGLVVPQEVERVDIYCDADAPKPPAGSRKQWLPSPGLQAAKQLKARLEKEGRTATIVTPPLGMDWLECLVANKRVAA